MFRGDISLNLDSKGRLAVPSRYRERLSESCNCRLVVTISLMDRCLVLYPLPEWQRIESEIQALPSLDPQARAISHLLIGHASECDMDGHGRILLPQSLRDFASLDKRVSLIGQVHKLEIWDASAWQSRREELLSQVGVLPAEISESLRQLVL